MVVALHFVVKHFTLSSGAERKIEINFHKFSNNFIVIICDFTQIKTFFFPLPQLC